MFPSLSINKIPMWLFLVFTIIHANYTSAQTNTSITPQIVPLDRSVLSGVDLIKIDMKNTPERKFYQKNLFRGDNLSVFVVGTQTWDSEMNNFPFDEFVYMYQGEAIVKPIDGPTQLFHAGDYFFAPKGFTGDWNINSGDHLHYEFSVISTKRADSTKIKKDQNHLLFDRSKLSGVHINLDEQGFYEETLVIGAELTVKLKAEHPHTQKKEPKSDLLIHILSGMVSVSDGNKDEQTFYAGDYFVLPKNSKVNWSSQGHGLVKYFTIEAS